jgi:hypothetical protein
MIVTQNRTLFAFACFVSITLSRAETPFSKSCHAIEGMVRNSACQMTECRVVGSTKVRFESGGASGLDAQGELVLLDHVCAPNSTISAIVSDEVQFLEGRGFAVQGSAIIGNASASVVLKKESQWVEVTAMMLEGAPNVAVRYLNPVREANPRLEQTRTPARSTTPAKATGAPPQAPPGVAASGGNLRVELELMVDERGTIQKVLSTKGESSLIPAALNAVKTWTVEPATEDGKPVPAVLALVLDFQPGR